MARITTKTKDLGVSRIQALIDKFKDRPMVTIGVQGTEAQATHAESSFTMVEILLVNEFGLNGIPERSVIRHTMTAHRAEIQEAGKVLFQQVINGKITLEMALGRMGVVILNLMRARIESNIAPALKAREGVALKDSGRLLSSFTFVVYPQGHRKEAA